MFRLIKSLHNKRTLELHTSWPKACNIAAHTDENKIYEGIKIELKDFDLVQITELNSLYNFPLKNKEELKRLHSFVDSNP